MTPAERLRAVIEAATAPAYARLHQLEERVAFRDAHTIRPGEEARYERLQEARRNWEHRRGD
jgi:hypothetical protein